MKAQVIFIDYLQLLTASKAKDRYQQITSISIALHELAQTTGILVVALAQLNRNAAHASPSTADLKESGQLEQDADAILLLSADKEEYQAILAKNKEGKIGEIPLTYHRLFGARGADTDTAASALQRHFDWVHSILIRCFGHHRRLHFQ